MYTPDQNGSNTPKKKTQQDTCYHHCHDLWWHCFSCTSLDLQLLH
jgi:hypothetical protein